MLTFKAIISGPKFTVFYKKSLSDMASINIDLLLDIGYNSLN